MQNVIVRVLLRSVLKSFHQLSKHRRGICIALLVYSIVYLVTIHSSALRAISTTGHETTIPSTAVTFSTSIISTAITDDATPTEHYEVLPKLNWDTFQFRSGLFGHSNTTKEYDDYLKERCKTMYLAHGGIVDTCFSAKKDDPPCCFCYKHYPNFILVDDRWASHINVVGEKPFATAISLDGHIVPTEPLYWFCLEPRMSQHDDEWANFDTSGKVVVVTGKWGYNDPFKAEVDYTCHIIKKTNYVQQKNVFCYSDDPDFVLQDERFARHIHYRTDPDDVSNRGAGYWFHKSILVHHQMEISDDGGYVVWVDTDRRNFFSKGHIHSIFKAMEHRNADFAIENMLSYQEVLYAKEDVIAAFNASESMLTSPQLNANAFIVRNTPRMRVFVASLVECISDWQMVNDESILPNRPGFIENRHDQTILSLLVKTFMTNETMVGPLSFPLYEDEYFNTYHLDDQRDPYCPFAEYHKRRKVEGPNVQLHVRNDIPVILSPDKQEVSSGRNSNKSHSGISNNDWCGEWVPNHRIDDDVVWEAARSIFVDSIACPDSQVGQEFIANADILFCRPDLNGNERVPPTLALDMQRNNRKAPNGNRQNIDDSPQQPQYSIISPSFSAATILPTTVQTLCAFTTGSWEIIFIVDGTWDDSLNVLVQALASEVCSNNTGLIRARVLFQPNSIFETSSDNLGFALGNPSHFYIEVQADMWFTEYGWNRDLVRPFFDYCDIITVSGRCGHTQRHDDLIGRCATDVDSTNETLHNETRDAVIITGTNIRGPLAIHADRLRSLGFFDEVNFFLANDDHDLNRRALFNGWHAAYKYASFFSPLKNSPSRNADLTKNVPQHIKKRDLRYRFFRLSLHNHSCDPMVAWNTYAPDDPSNSERRTLAPLGPNFDWNAPLPPLIC